MSVEIKAFLTIVAWLLGKRLTAVCVASPGVTHNYLTNIRCIWPRPQKGGHTQGSGRKHRGQDMTQRMNTETL